MAKRKWERQHHDRSDHGGTKAKAVKAKALVNAKARSRAVQHGVRVMGLG